MYIKINWIGFVKELWLSFFFKKMLENNLRGFIEVIRKYPFIDQIIKLS